MIDLYVRHPNVFLGPDTQIGEYVVLGVPPRNHSPGDLETRIGDRAVIRSHTVIYADNTIGNDFQTGHGVMIRESNQIGDNVSVGSHSVIEHHVLIEDKVRIHSNAFIPEFTILKSECWIGPNVVLTNARYPRSPHAKEELQGAHIESQAKIGANATVLPGVRIGARALVGAGSVVVRDVPPNKVVVGNPARVIGDISELTAYQLTKLARGSDR